MKINWKVRVKNVYFWFGLIAVILSAVGVSPETLTSWEVLCEQILSFLKNPFLIGCVIIALVGYINDPTTAGLSDSEQALTYTEPRRDEVTK